MIGGNNPHYNDPDASYNTIPHTHGALCKMIGEGVIVESGLQHINIDGQFLSVDQMGACLPAYIGDPWYVCN